MTPNKKGTRMNRESNRAGSGFDALCNGDFGDASRQSDTGADREPATIRERSTDDDLVAREAGQALLPGVYVRSDGSRWILRSDGTWKRQLETR